MVQLLLGPVDGLVSQNYSWHKLGWWWWGVTVRYLPAFAAIIPRKYNWAQSTAFMGMSYALQETQSNTNSPRRWCFGTIAAHSSNMTRKLKEIGQVSATLQRRGSYRGRASQAQDPQRRGRVIAQKAYRETKRCVSLGKVCKLEISVEIVGSLEKRWEKFGF